MPLNQANPTLDKFGTALGFAGDGVQGAILSGLGSRITVQTGKSEILLGVRIYTLDGFENDLTLLGPLVPGFPLTTDIVHGVDTQSSPEGTRNFIKMVTNKGTITRQFWVKDLPSTGNLYIDNQDAAGEAITFVNVGDSQELARVITFSINILPNFEDEFFTQQEYVLNRYAQTRRAWGGAATAEVFLNSRLIIPEQEIEDIHGYFWDDPAFGAVPITVRLRAKLGSAHYVDLTGKVRARQIPCST